jgi:hypothetical protein
MLLDAARGALPDLAASAERLGRFAEQHDFEAFHWFDLLAAVLARFNDEDGAPTMRDALARLTSVLGPTSRLARERRREPPTSAES